MQATQTFVSLFQLFASLLAKALVTKETAPFTPEKGKTDQLGTRRNLGFVSYANELLEVHRRSMRPFFFFLFFRLFMSIAE